MYMYNNVLKSEGSRIIFINLYPSSNFLTIVDKLIISKFIITYCIVDNTTDISAPLAQAEYVHEHTKATVAGLHLTTHELCSL